MKIAVDRMSVAAGDDAIPHKVVVDVPAEQRLADVVADLVGPSRFLASISGGRATWILVSGRRRLAVVAQQWNEPRYLVDPAEPIGESAKDGLMFLYWLQNDPGHVYAELEAGREPPPR